MASEIKYFSNKKGEEEKYLRIYKDWWESLDKKNIDNDEDTSLFFFDPTKFSGTTIEDIQRMNIYILSDISDSFDIDVKYGIGNYDKFINDAVNYSSTFRKIFKKFNDGKNEIKFYYGVEIDDLRKRLKYNLFNENIEYMFFNSGSVHPLRYCNLIEELVKNGEWDNIKDKLPKNMYILYGPFLLSYNSEHSFLKKMFEAYKENYKKDNLVVEIDETKTENYFRNHCVCFYDKNTDTTTIELETLHREYLLRRNVIDINIEGNYFNTYNDFKNFIKKYNINNSSDTIFTKIKNYEDLKDHEHIEMSDYFSAYSMEL